MPVWLVETEAEGPRDPRRAQEGDELLARGREPVDIGAAVNMGVEELRAFGYRPLELVVVRGSQPVRAFEQLRHAPRIAPGTCDCVLGPPVASQTSRRSAAQRVSSWRLDSWSLRSTAETCVSTVFTEMCRRSAISL